MIQITCKGNSAVCTLTDRLTSGMVGVSCKFLFDEAWDGLSKTAVFSAGKEQRDVPLIGDTCTVPWEVLARSGYSLTVGIYGTNTDGTLVIPTVYALCGYIDCGAEPSGDEGREPTPTLVEQIMAAAGQAIATANAVKEAWKAGELNGAQGVPGTNATVNGYPAVNIVAGDHVSISQEDSTITISAVSGTVIEYAEGEESSFYSEVIKEWVDSGRNVVVKMTQSDFTAYYTPFLYADNNMYFVCASDSTVASHAGVSVPQYIYVDDRGIFSQLN